MVWTCSRVNYQGSTVINMEGGLTLTAKTHLPRRWYALRGQSRRLYEKKLFK